MESEASTQRAARLTKLFNITIRGQRELKSPADGLRFLEALCAREDATKCVESVVAAPKGISAIAQSFRFSRDVSFLNGAATSVLQYLSHPSLKTLYGGEFLCRVLEAIVEPPTFWNTLVEAHHARILDLDATASFAWLLLELLCAKTDVVSDAREVAERINNDGSLINSPSLDVRNLGQKIKHFLTSTSSDSDGSGPGGRHDNDFVDFRKIRVIPTPDEFSSTDKPFYRVTDAINSEDYGTRGIVHLDNQFRLLREDLLGELRNDFQIAIGQRKGARKLVITNLEFDGADCGTMSRRKPCALRLRCTRNIPQMARLKDTPSRKAFLRDNKNFIKHQSFGCLISENEIVAFANVDRNEDLLAAEPPVLVLRIIDHSSLRHILVLVKLSRNFTFVQVETPVFAYEPILRCLQAMPDVPLKEQLLDLASGSTQNLSEVAPVDVVNALRNGMEGDVRAILGTPMSVVLDVAQAESLLDGLTKRVGLIQGPPGTGKSFIGALIAKILHDHTTETILVQTYTNHALDQFLNEIQTIGIPGASIVRLGNKSDNSTKHLKLSEQKYQCRMSGHTFNMIRDEKARADNYHDALSNKFKQYSTAKLDKEDLLSFLEFSDSEYFDAFCIPEEVDGMMRVGRDGKLIDSLYLFRQWMNGGDAGMFRDHAQQFPAIWGMTPEARLNQYNRWSRELAIEQASEVEYLVRDYDNCQDRLGKLFREKDTQIMLQKRIIGCTTTAAAMHSEELQTISPGVVLVEEAGEILESHVLTAMTPNTKQLILIGDHKQLRPKVNNFELTVEKGNGYDLNRSLFERLILAGAQHTVLSRQHRMRPEISTLVRNLTYPELQDADKTQNRPSLRGFQDNVIFVSHDHPELNAQRIADRRDEGAKNSKENLYEVEMVLACVRYLGQQGYGTDRLVVLTPYLGQLHLLVKTLSTYNDPILNDMDSFELIRAGLLTAAAANISKKRIRISTIDNYQGEESDIIIASLTRSNKNGDIGFMAAPQRVNVMLSRAKNALILIGNPDTFMNSRKGMEVWVPLLENLKTNGHIYDGFPVRCEQHPEKTQIIDTPDRFDILCPDGGCSESCGIMLSCGQHACPQRCHQLQDHSRMKCNSIITSTCPQNHTETRPCHDKASASCRACEAEIREKVRKRAQEQKLEKERQRKQAEYAARLQEVQEELEHEKRIMKNHAEEQDRKNALEQKRIDLANLRKVTQKVKQNEAEAKTAGSPTANDRSCSPIYPETHQNRSNLQTDDRQTNDSQNDSETSSDEADGDENEDSGDAKTDWDWQKSYEGAANKALDALMKMIGLESVKQTFLDIKSKVDTVVRQGVSLKGERFGTVLLGNPGTGKTTVARLYAQFLAEVGALPGGNFHETSGSSLANDGVTDCKAQINNLLQQGGGVFFIDEAYQLVSGNSPGGAAVLDYLLAEIENLTGSIIFVMAGYNKQMEDFFKHNPGIPSRIPIRMEFQDYTDQELQRILCHNLNAKYHGNMKVEDGIKGLYVRIVARRIGRGRGHDGFGNAREVQNKLTQITERQARRLRRERKAGQRPDDYLLTKEDLIGPEPSATLKRNPAWAKMRKMLGLKSVKESVQILLDSIQCNYERELEEKPLIQYSLNRCFVGSPGTGKTSVAKLYGRILADIGLLSDGEVVVKNPADFIGKVIGQSESNTKGILASSVGKVLIIDEAYMLAGGTGSSPPDPFKTAIIDTIVAEVQSVPGEDRCVVLLGYKDQMENMFRDVNPGLARRFPLDSSFVFEDFTDPELRQILDLKLKDIGFSATDQAKGVAMDGLRRARNRPNFGNAGEVDIILDKAKALHQKHVSAGKSKSKDILEAIDFDPDFERGQRAATNLPLLFQDVVGCDDLIKQLQGYQTMAKNLKEMGMDPREHIPFNFLFKGPPGTGKTTTAQRMGKVYYDMGFLAHAKVEECSATDMVGQYVGHTGPKTQKLLEKAMGKVLFIDEAYRLAEGQFATEAMDELVDCLTKPKFARKLIVILAGYDRDMDRLMSINPGLTSRFPESIIFKPLDPPTCLELLTKVLIDIKKKKKAPLDVSFLVAPNSDVEKRILELFHGLAQLASWGNARDVKELAKVMFGTLVRTAVTPISNLVLTEKIVIDTMEAMFKERSQRNQAVGTTRHSPRQPHLPIPPSQTQDFSAPPAPKIDTKMSTGTSAAKKGPPKPPKKEIEKVKKNDPGPPSTSNSIRDAGVSDDIWHQLELDKQATLAREQEYQRRFEESVREEQRLRELERAEREVAEEAERLRLEEERIRIELERVKKEEELKALERERAKEKALQEKISRMGVCPMGYMWIRQAGGYRCAGGSHYLSNNWLGV